MAAMRRRCFSSSSAMTDGRSLPVCLSRNPVVSATSSSQYAFGTLSSSSMSTRPSPAVLIAPGAGTSPTAVGVAMSSSPASRRHIHSMTRTFSPKPGQRKRPAASRRNQLTWNTFGMCRPGWSRSSQCCR